MSVGRARTRCSLSVCVCWVQQRKTFEEESVGCQYFYSLQWKGGRKEEKRERRERVEEREGERKRERVEERER